ncbi:MAG: glycosyltransferase, partial [Chloroflexales bacterium]|nr:glycosyltransferase [Chloroflexales bacterium]
DLAAAFRLSRSGALARPLVRYAAASRVDRFIAVSPGTAQQIHTTLGVAPERIEVVPNGVDLQRVAALAATAPALPLPPVGRTRLVAVGRLHPQKGTDVLLRAVAQMCAAGIDVECVLVGEGEEGARLKALAHALGLGERAIFAGRVANPFAWLKTAQIFVLPSRWEPFGIALIEAMAMGLPVVASATDGARSIVTHEVDGLLVPAGDVGALAEALSALARTPALRHALGERGRERAQHYDAALVAARYQQALEPLLQAPAAFLGTK